MYEILLTRIFSVTMWYHYAFMAISIAMFGMTAGAILVYLAPRYFREERAKPLLAVSALLFGAAILVSFTLYLRIPASPGSIMARAVSLAATYLLISLPFVLSGICVCLALTKFPGQASTLYGADLAGAAVGCLLLIVTLNLTDGPTAVMVTAFLACAGAVCFALDGGTPRLKGVMLAACCLFGIAAGVHFILSAQERPVLRLLWAKGRRETLPLYEKWNSFSRVRVDGNPATPEEPSGWGLSSTYPADSTVRQLHLNIDASAGTVLTAFDGDPSSVRHLRFDVTNIAHYIRHDARVLVIGTGGGRDVLSALAFGQRAVVGVDINRNIIDAVNVRFGDFTGHLDRDPRVTFVNDEARSWVARSGDAFDIIQISLIDTWAATAAGAFVLTENSLYTVEAWKIFLGHLRPHGVLTVSRWYFRDNPGEVYRLASLASAALLDLGVHDPRSHMVIVRHLHREEGTDTRNGIGTILVSREAFPAEDLQTLAAVDSAMRFDPILTPGYALDSTFAAIASGKDLEAFTAGYPLNISAPTDDSPFFFNMLRPRDLLGGGHPDQGSQSFNLRAVVILGTLLLIVVVLTAVCIILPLLLTTDKSARRGSLPLSLFFLCIGVGFMQVEISQMQRLIIFLGHPTYGLSVILFALLLSSGLGSFTTLRVGVRGGVMPAMIRLVLLLFVLALFGILTLPAIRACEDATTPVRILVAAVLLFPPGLFMGMAFPLGIKLAARTSPSLTPWFWGINGAASVCASVLAVAIALGSSISTSFWFGFAAYVLAVASFSRAGRRAAAVPGG